MNCIKMLREKNNLSQKALAEKLDISQQAVAMWETGGKLPRTRRLPELANVLGCSVNDLFGKEDGPAGEDGA